MCACGNALVPGSRGGGVGGGVIYVITVVSALCTSTCLLCLCSVWDAPSSYKWGS